MDTSINVKWNGKMAFETSLQGHKLVMDAAPDNGGEDTGMRPKSLLLAGLAGCTGMDVVSILAKMRVELEDFDMVVEADIEKEHPKYYNRINVIYQFKGKDLPLDKLQKAVDLSFERYCGVIGLFKKAIPVTTEIRIL
jgi:putative redox protein